jgi:alpha-L-fucosidase
MKKNVNFKFLLCAVALCYGNAYAQTSSESVEEPMETGIYEANWESLSQYEVPEWFRDAKFGIWAHWGPQCEPESGDWYARHMYFPGHWQYNAHVNKYGNPAEFGFKDVINIWKAASWDPEYLIRFYKSVGARYFMALANHHDNFDLWDSKYQPWNSVNMGPKQDIVGKWAEQCKKYGLPLGVSIHASHAWTWMEGSQDFDGKLTKEDGVGKWWEGYDPQDLYAQNHPRSENSHDVGAIHSQWEWGNGAAEMTEEYKTKFYNRTLDVINKYNPDMVYFDDSTLPFYPVSDEGLKIAAHMYNKSLKDHDNQMRAVIMGKKLTEEQKDAMIWDVERGIPDRCQEKAWQTCTCLGQWHYDRGVYDRNEYKSAATVVKMLIDIVSKNGNLLLSVPVRGNGTIDEKEVAILNGIKGWMDVNYESIYGTRPWTIFGEGPTAEASNPINNQGFNEGTNYTSDDIRFVERHDTVYVTAMGWPETNQMVVKSLASTSPYYNNKIKEVKLLGYEGDVEYTCDKTALTVELPAEMSSTIAPVLMVRFTDEVNYADLESLRQEVAVS